MATSAESIVIGVNSATIIKTSCCEQIVQTTSVLEKFLWRVGTTSVSEREKV